MRRLLPAILLVAAACVVVAHPHPPPPRLLTAQEAVNAATYFARSRGLIIDATHDVRLDRHARWHVDLGGAGGRDRAIVLVDGYSGHVISARLHGPRGAWSTGPAPGEVSPAPPPESSPPGAAPPGQAAPMAPPGTTPPPGDVPPPPAEIPPPPPGAG